MFPLLIAPAYALGGAIAVQLMLAAIAAIAFVLAAALARRLVPEPWATGGALVVGLSPPAIVAATTIAPDAIAGTALAGAALLALRVRERPLLLRSALPCALLLAVLPWLGAKFAVPAAIVAAAAARWLLRRRRGIAGLVAVEVVVFSAVLYVTVNDRLYGGPIPESVRAGAGPTGADTLGEHLARAPRLLGLWIDRDAGLLRWAPFAVLALAALWLLVRSRRERLASVLSDQIDVEVTAGFLAAIGGATYLVAAFLAPTIAGPWFAGHELACVLFVAGALGGWALRRFPRTGRVLATLTLVASLWLLVVARLDADAGLAPPRGPLPWLGAEDALPRLR